MPAFRRRTVRAYNPKTFREADAAVARLMRDLQAKADAENLVYVGNPGAGGRWVQRGENVRVFRTIDPARPGDNSVLAVVEIKNGKITVISESAGGIKAPSGT